MRTPLESGGILLGYWATANTAVVTAATLPGPNSRHERYSYSPDTEFDNVQLREAYQASSGSVTYLGDWHTHPKGSTDLSKKDKSALRTISGSKEARAPSPLMIVLGKGESAWSLGVWRHESTIFGLQIVRQTSVCVFED